ncbi:MAG: exodeoxyribonuclease VII large subunit [Pirellulales bacterium]|nr:exodeoxyribonuclease VII large subunit [Pirellulales bacterium]
MQHRYLTVSQLSSLIKENVEASFPFLWVAGEISNFTRSAAGHCYLTLKDEHAQLRAVIWRSTAMRFRFELQDGLEILCGGCLEVYTARGTYQLVVQQAQPQGMGALELALRQLREKLTAEGLFDVARKRPLPKFPRTIGIVTSLQGAAIADMLQTLQARWTGVGVIIAPVRVQGEGAENEIASAIVRFNRMKQPVDTLIVGRGGGSLEDLWAFNSERVVRAIHASKIPVISAVGHEIDTSLSDLAADVRALTPTDAAQKAVPDREEIVTHLNHLGRHMARSLARRAHVVRARVEQLAATRTLSQPMAALIHDRARHLDELSRRAEMAMRQRLQRAEQSIARTAARLETLSPLGVLARGYSVTQTLDGRVVTDVADLSPGDKIITRYAQGQTVSQVEEVDSE